MYVCTLYVPYARIQSMNIMYEIMYVRMYECMYTHHARMHVLRTYVQIMYVCMYVCWWDK